MLINKTMHQSAPNHKQKLNKNRSKLNIKISDIHHQKTKKKTKHTLCGLKGISPVQTG